MVARPRRGKLPADQDRQDFFRRLEAARAVPGDELWRPELRRVDRDLIRDWADHLAARRIAWTTIQSYVADMANLARFVSQRPGAFDLGNYKPRDVQAWLAQCITDGLSDNTHHRRYMSARAFDNWLVGIGELDKVRVPDQAPRVSLRDIDLIPVGDFEKLCAAISNEARVAMKHRRQRNVPAWTELIAKRDLALVLIAMGCGLRVDELSRLTLDDLDRDANTITVRHAKGGDERRVAVPHDLGKISERLPSPLDALNQYRRARDQDPRAIDTDALWLSKSTHGRTRARMTANGIRLMLRKRCEHLGLPRMTPHRFRHTFAHYAKVHGMQDGDLKQIGGWSSDAMVHRYGRSHAQARAIDVQRQIFSGDD